MDGFSAIPMAPYLASPLSLNSNANNNAGGGGGGGGTMENMMAMLPTEMGADQASNFDTETFAGSEDTFATSAYGYPALKRFSMSYEDPFAEPFNPMMDKIPQDQAASDNPAVEGDNRLLSFSAPSYNYTLLDFSGQRTMLSVAAQLHGMFFLAESPWAAAGENPTPPTELTCYRRNLFQISGSMTVPRTLTTILTEQGEPFSILGLELALSATESVEGNMVKIISVPWKTPAANPPTMEEKAEREPTPIPIDWLGSSEIDSEHATVPITWKRLQFRIATANNGRRRELQQHFVVRLKLMASLQNGGKIPICEMHTGPIIVRGRSPRNFQARKDTPLNGGGAASRRGGHGQAAKRRTSTAGSTSQAQTGREAVKSPDSRPPPPSNPFKTERANLQLSPELLEWSRANFQDTGPLTAFPTITTPAMGADLGAENDFQQDRQEYAQSSPDLTRNPPKTNRSASLAPINLSLTDEELPASKSVMQSQRAKSRKAPRHAAETSPRQPMSAKFTSGSSPPDESADLLYEYFPLGLDDWMPPVDAVYRPHVVHHTNLPPDPKAQAAKNRSKRYFSEDQPS